MFKIRRVYFHNGRKKLGIQLRCLITQTSQGHSSIFSVHVPLIFIVFRLYKTVWGAVTVIWLFRDLGFPSHFTLVFWVCLGTLPGSQVISWSFSYLCGSTSATCSQGSQQPYTPPFKSSPITESLFTAKLVIISLFVWGIVNLVVRRKSTKI